MIILFLINFTLLYLLLVDYNKNFGSSVFLRKPFIQTIVFCALAVFLTTEALSLFDQITRSSFVLLHSLILLVLVVIIYKKFRDKNFFFQNPLLLIRSLDKRTKIVLFLIILFIILPLLFIAIYFPPNTADSMTYHLSRIEHWAQNQNVEYYPTNNFRQLYYQPLSEYMMLHLRLLDGSDYFVSLVQLISMLGSVVAVTLLAKLFGLRRRGQMLAAIIAITAPMGIAQATSTQNDYLLAFFFLAFIYYSIKIMQSRSLVFRSVVFAGLTLGLMLLTKATAYILVIPVLGWLGIETALKHRLKTIKLISILFIISVLINTPYFIRNIKISNGLFGGKETDRIVFNEKITLKNTASNIIRSIGLQVGLPIPAYNKFIDVLVYGAHDILGISADSSENTVNAWPIKYRTQFVPTEEHAGNFAVVLALIISLVLVAVKKKKFSAGNKEPLIYFLSLLAGFILFASVLKWHPWQSRLLLPLTVGSSVFIAFVFTKYFKPGSRNISYAIAAFMILAIPFVVGNHKKSPLLIPFDDKTREEKYFNGAPEYYESYRKTVAELKEKSIKNIGLALRWDAYEYPLWVMLDANNNNIKIKYFDFPNFLKNTKNYDSNFEFHAIITDYNDLSGLVNEQMIENLSDNGKLKLIVL